MYFALLELDEKHWKRWLGLADQCQKSLTAQQIAPGNPGTILKDVELLLGFVGPEGIVLKGRNATLPSERLPELNQKSSYPVELCLKRALLRDYPNLGGIFILLRVMDLLQMRGTRLVVCPEALEFWRGLNPTEQYFALLETLLFQAQSSVLGGPRTREEPQAFHNVAVFLGQLSNHWRNFNIYHSVDVLGPLGELPPWNVVVQQQLGLVELRPRPYGEKERRTWGGNSWLVGGAKLTPWGTALTWALLQCLKSIEDEEAPEDAQPRPDKPEPQMELLDEAAPPLKGAVEDSTHAARDEDDADWEEAQDESESELGLGSLQPPFQRYFPEWRTVYALPAPEVATGTYIFKIALVGWHGDGSIWRRLAAPPGTCLDDLAREILRVFNLYDTDHAYNFQYRDRRGRRRIFHYPWMDEGPFTTEICIGETELPVKGEMHFKFDYGDNWEFDVRLEEIDPQLPVRRLKLLEAAGESPQQYPPAEE